MEKQKEKFVLNKFEKDFFKALNNVPNEHKPFILSWILKSALESVPKSFWKKLFWRKLK